MVSRQNKTEPREISTGRKTVQPVIKAVAWIDRQTERQRETKIDENYQQQWLIYARLQSNTGQS